MPFCHMSRAIWSVCEDQLWTATRTQLSVVRGMCCCTQPNLLCSAKPQWNTCTNCQECALRPAGADWQMFNASQKQMRRAMLSLYGSKKRLVPPRAPLDLTGPMGRTIHLIFIVQVRMLLWPLSSILLHFGQVCMLPWPLQSILILVRQECRCCHATSLAILMQYT